MEDQSTIQKDVEKLLAGFLRALLNEQKQDTSGNPPETFNQIAKRAGVTQ